MSRQPPSLAPDLSRKPAAVYRVSRELPYSVRVLEVEKNGRPLCVITEPTLELVALPGSLSGEDGEGVAEAVFAYLIAEEQASFE